MALVQNTLIGKAKKSIGNVTFTSSFGRPVIKSKAVNSYSNPTPVQVENNTKFGVFSQWAKTIAAFVQVGFKSMTSKMTAYNALSKTNPYSVSVDGTAPDYFVNPAVIQLSKGPELQNAIASPVKTADGANAISVDWAVGLSSHQTYPVYAAAFDNNTGELLASSLAASTIDDEGLTLTATGIGTNIASITVHLFYVNPVNGLACDSIML